MWQREDVAKWENLEHKMVALYSDPSQDLSLIQYDDQEMSESYDDNDMEFEVASTWSV